MVYDLGEKEQTVNHEMIDFNTIDFFLKLLFAKSYYVYFKYSLASAAKFVFD